MPNGHTNGNGNGVGWKVIAMAACAVVFSLAGAWAKDIHNKVERNRNDISAMLSTLSRIETKLDTTLQKRVQP